MYDFGRSPRRIRRRRTLTLAVIGAAGVAAVLIAVHGTRHRAPVASRTAAAPAAGIASSGAGPAGASGAATPTLAAAAGIAPISLAAVSYELLDVRTGRVLVAVNPDQEIAPASLAKLMTFDLTLQALAAGRIHLTDAVPLGPGVRTLSATRGLSNMYLDLPPGATVPLQQLMLGAMVASGNDAALAIAEYVGGTDAHFVSMMNAEAAKLGMTHTHFANPNGLDVSGQVTTAADMAILARHVWLTYPKVYAQFTDVPTFTWRGIVFHNYNALIGVDSAVTGMKSGYWGGVGWHLVTSAQEGSTELVGVVMGTATLPASAQISRTLLDWGFAHFSDVRVGWTQALPAAGIRVWKAKAPHVALDVAAQPWIVVPNTSTSPTSTTAVPTVKATLPTYLEAPVRQGQVVGTVQALEGGHVVATAPVVARSAVPRGSLPAVLWGGFRLWLRHL